jgi:anti-sigma28 factor (negative regulator of flagellin synthesis)
MKINSSGSGSVSFPPPAPKPSPAQISTPSADRVSVISAAVVQQAKSDIQAKQPARLEKIAAQVQDGSYVADPEQIASGILDDASLSAHVLGLLGSY